MFYLAPATQWVRRALQHEVRDLRVCLAPPPPSPQHFLVLGACCITGLGFLGFCLAPTLCSVRSRCSMGLRFLVIGRAVPAGLQRTSPVAPGHLRTALSAAAAAAALAALAPPSCCCAGQPAAQSPRRQCRGLTACTGSQTTLLHVAQFLLTILSAGTSEARHVVWLPVCRLRCRADRLSRQALRLGMLVMRLWASELDRQLMHRQSTNSAVSSSTRAPAAACSSQRARGPSADSRSGTQRA